MSIQVAQTFHFIYMIITKKNWSCTMSLTIIISCSIRNLKFIYLLAFKSSSITRPEGNTLSTRPTRLGGQILWVTLPFTNAKGIYWQKTKLIIVMFFGGYPTNLKAQIEMCALTAPKVLESKLTLPLSPSTQHLPLGTCKISYDPGTLTQSPWSAINLLTIHLLGSSGDL